MRTSPSGTRLLRELVTRGTVDDPRNRQSQRRDRAGGHCGFLVARRDEAPRNDKARSAPSAPEPDAARASSRPRAAPAVSSTTSRTEAPPGGGEGLVDLVGWPPTARTRARPGGRPASSTGEGHAGRAQTGPATSSAARTAYSRHVGRLADPEGRRLDGRVREPRREPAQEGADEPRRVAGRERLGRAGEDERHPRRDRQPGATRGRTALTASRAQTSSRPGKK